MRINWCDVKILVLYYWYILPCNTQAYACPQQASTCEENVVYYIALQNVNHNIKNIISIWIKYIHDSYLSDYVSAWLNTRLWPCYIILKLESLSFSRITYIITCILFQMMFTVLKFFCHLLTRKGSRDPFERHFINWKNVTKDTHVYGYRIYANRNMILYKKILRIFSYIRSWFF